MEFAETITILNVEKSQSAIYYGANNAIKFA